MAGLEKTCGKCDEFKGQSPDGYGKCLKLGRTMRDDDPCLMEPDAPRRGSVLLEAEKTINGARQDCYGSPEDSFRLIADFWTAWVMSRTDYCIGPHDVAMMMALMKIARIAHGAGDRDSYRDAAGYIGLACDMDNAKDREKD